MGDQRDGEIRVLSQLESMSRLANEKSPYLAHSAAQKLDRDERPDIDRRYQRAVTAMGAAGGWPLSVFLTPDKKPFFGGTYFPPEDSQGRPGFKKVLQAIIDLYHSSRGEVDSYTERLMNFIRPN